ncbi:TetR family transcriptional regulator [Actinoplanes oblitus]|uniref:TetR family transcriptional regulator n=1 Tax=Actinoplanes oblitus TaxID=3040509 RepID=A0ABY8WJB1_9ACTN|nr:TetR family transcriptional regulator [Actinoplanes oblitus]WIM96434.1 TetR family transcriptional regulator [Actinoplanes oblitus]
MEDKRIKRTRRQIHRALIELSHQVGFDAISVVDITSRAGIGRTTFYRHYSDKYELVEALISGLNRIFPIPGPDDDGDLAQPVVEEHLIEIFDHFARNARLYQALLIRHRSEWFTDLLNDRLNSVVLRLLNADCCLSQQSADRLRATAAWITGGLIGAVIYWLRDSGERPYRAIVQVCSDFTSQSFAHFPECRTGSGHPMSVRRTRGPRPLSGVA